MAGFLITLVLSIGMMGAIWMLLAPRRKRLRGPSELPGGLSAAERRRLYDRLGLDPQEMTRSAHSNVIWMESHRAGKKRSTRA